MDVRFLICVSAVVIASALACAHVEGAEVVRLASRVEFRDATGEVSFRLEPDAGDVRIEDADGLPLVVLGVEAGGLSISDGRRRRLGLVQPLEQRVGFRVLAHEGGNTVLELRVEPDGDLSLLSREGVRLYQVKRRDYGFKVVGAEGQLRSKVRARSTKTSLRSGSGETYLWTRDSISAAAVAALALDDVRFDYAAALCVAIVHWGISEAEEAEPSAPES